MEKRKFTSKDQNAFAQLSGDYNPIHLDDLAARRSQFGQPIVHGIHVVLWALDCYFKGQGKMVELCSLKVVFQKPVLLDQEVSCSFSSLDGTSAKIDVFVEEARVATITVVWKAAESKAEKKLFSRNPKRSSCKESRPPESKDICGELELCFNVDAASKLFPHLVKKAQLKQLAEVLATTRLVGMEYPGYYSIFSELDVSFAKKSDHPLTLNYKVLEHDERFSLSSINVTGPSMSGMIKAFFRAAPRDQESFSDLRKKLDGKEFKGQEALIIGGSRGLGEVTAKLLAAGGARVRITFYKGEEDAQRVVKEIVSQGGFADCVPFNVLNVEPNAGEIVSKEMRPTHLYYFATPAIFTVKYKNLFSQQLFENFCGYYVNGFASTVDCLHKAVPELKNIFYPSSVAIDEVLPSLAEYICSKAAGEIFCDLLAQRYKNWIIYKPRLPRMATDQTASLLSDHDPDPADIILNHIRVFRDLGKR